MINRRRFMALVTTPTVGTIAGCASSGDKGQRAPTDSETQNFDNDQTQSEIERTPTGAQSPEPLSPPEGRFSVSKDGSGDYESLTDALKVAQPKDVISVSEGSYDYDLSSAPSQITIVGAGRNVTDITFQHTSDEMPVKKSSLTFWDCSVTAEEGSFIFFRNSNITLNRAIYSIITLNLPGRFYEYEDTIGGVDSIINKSCQIGQLELEQSEINAGLDVHFDKSQDCVFNAPVLGYEFSSSNNEYRKGVWARHPFGTINDSTIMGLELGHLQTTKLIVDNCKISKFPNEFVSGMDSLEAGTAIWTWDSSDRTLNVEIINCTIDGKIHSRRPVKPLGGTPTTGGGEEMRSSVRAFIGNVFESNGEYQWFIDENDPEILYGNVFKGADVRLGNSDTEAYNAEKEYGNYYSEWERVDEDENEDGIVDVPRLIPGEGEVDDQYPLSEPSPPS